MTQKNYRRLVEECLHFVSGNRELRVSSVDDFVEALQYFISQNKRWKRRLPRATIAVDSELLHYFPIDSKSLSSALQDGVRKGLWVSHSAKEGFLQLSRRPFFSRFLTLQKNESGAIPSLSEEVLQGAFDRYLRSLESFKPGKPSERT